jgi:hypothetical protein
MANFFRRKTPEELNKKAEELKAKEQEIQCSKWVNKLETLISENLYTTEIETILMDKNTTGCTKEDLLRKNLRTRSSGAELNQVTKLYEDIKQGLDKDVDKVLNPERPGSWMPTPFGGRGIRKSKSTKRKPKSTMRRTKSKRKYREM